MIIWVSELIAGNVRFSQLTIAMITIPHKFGRIRRHWHNSQHHEQRKQDAQKSFFHIVSSQ